MAVRENTVYVAQRPELPDAKARLYLDVEGLPDEDFYYLIGLTVVEDEYRDATLAFWADRRGGRGGHLGRLPGGGRGPVEDFVLFHYGSYESQFLERMEARHGGDPGLLARLKARSVNVLSLIYARVYFPVYSNDLKSVAGCLGFRWSAPDASGLAVDRLAARLGGDRGRGRSSSNSSPTTRRTARPWRQVVAILRSLGGESAARRRRPGRGSPGSRTSRSPVRHKFGDAEFALPEFARITKCAYFDYQRDKVLCRTNPAREDGRPPARNGAKRGVWKVNREVECGRPDRLPALRLDRLRPAGAGTRRLVIDLKPFRGGLKRWVTRYKARRYRCRKCRGTFLPDGLPRPCPSQVRPGPVQLGRLLLHRPAADQRGHRPRPSTTCSASASATATRRQTPAAGGGPLPADLRVPAGIACGPGRWSTPTRRR